MLCRPILYCITTIFLITIVTNSYGQLCQGSLGDPIVFINFGSGPNPGPALSAATTNYQYVDSMCPKDGAYTVTNITTRCHDSTWFTVTDHTNNGNGYFMLVNASFQPGQFYLDTVSNLCAGSTYEFAAWLVNVKRPVLCWGATQIINPDITFRIERLDGTLLQSYNTGSIVATDPATWKQYGFFFTTPSGVNTVVIRMVNNAPGGCGNDIGLDDITFRPCGPQVSTAIVGGISSSEDSLCEGTAKNYTLNAQVSSGYNNPVLQWQQSSDGNIWNDVPGATSNTLSQSFSATASTGKYYYRILVAESGNMGSANCRIASQPVIITVVPKENISISSNSPVCIGSAINLNAQGNSITWTGPNSYSASGTSVSIPNAQSSNAGTYYAISTKGSCSWRDSLVVSLLSEPAVTTSASSLNVCEGDSIQLSAAGAVSYLWGPSNVFTENTSANVVARSIQNVLCSVIGSDANGCTDTAYVQLNIIKKPQAIAGPDVSILKGSTVQLNGAALGDSITYHWTPDYAITGKQSLSPYVTPQTDTTYILNVESTAGCGVSSDSVKVFIIPQLFIPNAFSPNNDNVNDKWVIKGLESFVGSRLKVFDRYGQVVFEIRNSAQPWDGRKNGKDLPVGTYYYLIEPGNNMKPLAGNVTIFR